MTDYFDIEYRKKCRKRLVEYLYDLLIRTNIPHPILAFVLKSCHFLISYIIALLVFSQLEYKLHDKDFINIVDPYLAIVGWDINDENRYTITMYIVCFYFAILFSILYWRINR